MKNSDSENLNTVGSETRYPVKVWDISIRIFHWGLAILIAFLWWSGTEGVEMENHVLAGYGVIFLVCYRVIWGFIGSHHARFRHFLRSPVSTLKAIPDVISVRSGSRHTGHNPVGAWMVVALLLILLAQGITGLGTTDDIFIDGPLVEYLDEDTVALFSDWHTFLPDFILGLVILHLAAVFYHDAVKRERLVRSMITGVKYTSIKDSASELPVGRFLLVMGGLSAMGWWLLSDILF